MKKEINTTDALLFLITIMLSINTFINLQPKRVEAETFRLDDCVTTKPDERPAAYLHVISH